MAGMSLVPNVTLFTWCSSQNLARNWGSKPEITHIRLKKLLEERSWKKETFSAICSAGSSLERGCTCAGSQPNSELDIQRNPILSNLLLQSNERSLDTEWSTSMPSTHGLPANNMKYSQNNTKETESNYELNYVAQLYFILGASFLDWQFKKKRIEGKFCSFTMTLAFVSDPPINDHLAVLHS